VRPSLRTHRLGSHCVPRPDTAYVVAETSLSRYGLAYVCHHPDILLGYDPVDRNALDGRVLSAVSDGVSQQTRDWPQSDRTYHGGLAHRVREAYSVLNDLYAAVPTRLPRTDALARPDTYRRGGNFRGTPRAYVGRGSYR